MFKVFTSIILLSLLKSFNLNATSIQSSETNVTLNETNTDSEELKVTFLLFTPKDPNKQIIFNNTSDDIAIRNSGFDPNLRTKFIVHGWMGGYFKPGLFKRMWMKDIKDFVLNQIDCNVICVDWSEPAGSYDYVGVLPNVKKTGQIIANFIQRLSNLTDTSPINMHCIGHSLGAHVCGFVGKTLGLDKLAQITGLDPAWPGFDTNTQGNTTTALPLNVNDANLVLVMHTSAGFNTGADDFSLVGFVGNPNSLGHYDFRINGGNAQPMCHEMGQALGSLSSLFNLDLGQALEGLSEAAVCPHESAYIYPTVGKPDSGCQLIAYKCSNYDDFEGGKCADEGMPLEFNFDYYENSENKLNETDPPNNLFIKTGDTAPYCLFHYQIVVETENELSSNETELKFFGRKKFKVQINFWPNNYQNIYHGLYTDENEIGPISKVSYKNNGVKIKAVYVNYMSHIDKNVRKEKSMKPKIIEKSSDSSWFGYLTDLVDA